MSHKSLAATFVPLLTTLITVSTGAVFASSPQVSAQTGAEPPAELTEALTVLHEVNRWAVDLSGMADERAKSGLVKDFAREVTTSGATKDAKLKELARKQRINLAPLDPQTEAGKSLLDRMKAEKAMLGSLEGDAFDKEYMTLVTNTQQSVLQFLKARKATAKDPAVKQFMGEMLTTVQRRLKTAQEVMLKVYGNDI